tara:strand:+ start:426 stop:2789 length:2364 start_codon:yes stop_codon:yes gene_type:complete
MIKPKQILLIFSFLAFIISGFYLNLTISNNCKSFKIISSVKDFGLGHIDNCYSKNNLVNSIKKILSSSPVLYEIARKYRRTFITSYYILDNPPTQKEVDFAKEQELKSSNLKKPFIKGILENSNQNNLEVKEKTYNFENWSRSHGDHINSKYNPNKQINIKNIKKLKLIWKYDSIREDEIKKKYIQNIQSNPIFVDGKIISITADWRIVAHEVENGNLLWDLQSIHMPGRRGMVSFRDQSSQQNYIFVPLGNKIYKINVANGKPEKKFGNNGFIKGYFTLVAPLIYKKKLIVVTTNGIYVFDINNGKLLSQKNLNHKEKNFERGAIWGGIALDKKNGIVFANTGNPQPGIYGVHRPGINHHSSSVLAYDLNSEKLLWTFQDVAHDLWDFDIASPPILHDLRIKDKFFEVVISLTKTGNALILERKTGRPIFDIGYKKAPSSNLIGDFANPFQIFLNTPERFSKIEYGHEDYDELSKTKIDEIEKKLRDSIFGWFETPSLSYDLITFGLHGGAQWMGASLDPYNQFLYIPVNSVPWKLRPYVQSREIKTFFNNELKESYKLYINKCSACHGKNRNGKNVKYKEKQLEYVPNLVGYYTIPGIENKLDNLKLLENKHKNLTIKQNEIEMLKKLFETWDKKINDKNEIKIEGNGMAWSQFLTKDGLPASNPPWGYIAKLNLETGKIEWKAAHGDLKINGKNQKIGTMSFGGTALNGSDILFFTGTEDSKAYALDAKSGKELWSYKMSSAGSTAPIIFNFKGKQFVTFLATGGSYHNYVKKSSTIYTFGIDD